MNALTTQARGGLSLAPTNFNEAMQAAHTLAKSSMIPEAYRGKAENIYLAIAWGSEIGLAPLQALNAIAVINGRPSLWGDAVLALVRGHPACVSVREGVEGEGDERRGYCEIIRRGEAMQRREFSIADAKVAKLWGKAGPWQQYPDRMLQMRARGFAVRDVFPDALRGVTTVEEARDEPREVPNLAAAEAVLEQYKPSARPVETTAAGPEEELPLVYMDGEIRAIRRGAKSGAPASAVWRGAALREIAKAESHEALRLWHLDNGPNFLSIEAAYPDEVAEVVSAIGSRLERFILEAGDAPTDQE